MFRLILIAIVTVNQKDDCDENYNNRFIMVFTIKRVYCWLTLILTHVLVTWALMESNC